MSRWDATEILIHVIDHGSFSAAADYLGLSKSHVSRQISQLENRLGTQLINRTTRRLSLTETGQAYYQRCRDIVNQLDEAEQAVLDQQQTPRGTLRLTVAGAFGERFVAPAAARFMQQHAHLNIHLDFTARNVDLLAEGYDLAIRAGTLKDSSLIARRIANRQLIICASRDYINRYGTPEQLQSLKKHSCLVGSIPTWRFKDHNGHHLDLKVDGRWHSNNGHALLQAARAGLGLVQLPRFYVHDDLAAGRLLSVLESYAPTDTAVWAVYPSNRHLSPKVRLFIDYLHEQFFELDEL